MTGAQVLIPALALPLYTTPRCCLCFCALSLQTVQGKCWHTLMFAQGLAGQSPTASRQYLCWGPGRAAEGVGIL